MPPVAGAASTAVRDLLSGPVREGRVVGVHPSYVYVVTGTDLVAVETADALGLPCAVRLGVDRAAGPLSGVRTGDDALVGHGRLVAGPLTVRVARWWAPPRPRPARAGPSRGRATPLAALLAAHPAPVPVDGSVGDLLGRGPGLTPAGDDVLAGMLVGLHRHPTLRDPLADAVLPLSTTRTTALSAALLRTSAAGHHVPAVIHLADLLSGHGADGELPAATARLLAVGHSSGTALAHGLLRAARTVAAQEEAA